MSTNIVVYSFATGVMPVEKDPPCIVTCSPSYFFPHWLVPSECGQWSPFTKMPATWDLGPWLTNLRAKARDRRLLLGTLAPDKCLASAWMMVPHLWAEASLSPTRGMTQILASVVKCPLLIFQSENRRVWLLNGFRVWGILFHLAIIATLCQCKVTFQTNQHVVVGGHEVFEWLVCVHACVCARARACCSSFFRWPCFF